MFGVFVSRRERRAWSSGTIAVSVLVHLVLLGGVLSVATGTPAPDQPPGDTIVWLANVDAPPPDPADPPSDEPTPTTGETLEVPRVDEVPDDIPPVDSLDTPVDPRAFSGEGPTGEVIGRPAPATAGPTPPPAVPEPAEPFECGLGEDDECGMEMVEELPTYRDPGDAARTLRRAYPAILAGVAGRTEVKLVIDRRGEVVPGSVEVVSTTHEAFGEAAMKAMEKIRFHPARINGLPVSVSITMPVSWRLES